MRGIDPEQPLGKLNNVLSIADVCRCQNHDRRSKQYYSIKKHKDCDEWCCSRIELVGHHASRENHANNKHYEYGQSMINVRAISIFIVVGGRLSSYAALPYSGRIG
jgi:hypothetical protein